MDRFSLVETEDSKQKLHLGMGANPPSAIKGWHPAGWHLGIKIPTETVREMSYYPQASNRWLNAHPNGFLVVAIENGQSSAVLCLRSLDDNQLYITKRPKNIFSRAPSDLRFARLEGHHIETQLPNNSPMFAKMHAYGLPNNPSDFGQGEPRFPSLYYERLNGGDLFNLIASFDAADKFIPESFVWHVVDQVGHALAFLHTGLTREELVAGETEPKPSWKPIVHRNVRLRNILLDYGDDPSELDKCFPRIVLGGFSRAGRLADPELWWKGGVIDEEHDIKCSTRDDIRSLGNMLRLMVESWKELWNGRKRFSPVLPLDQVGENVSKTAASTRSEGNTESGYSKRLMTLLSDTQSKLAEPNIYFQGTEIEHDRPKVDFYIHSLLPEARRMMEKYRAMRAKQLAQTCDVSWTRPELEEAIYRPWASDCDGARQLTQAMQSFSGPYEIVKISYDENGDPLVSSINEEDAAEMNRNTRYKPWDPTAWPEFSAYFSQNLDHARQIKEEVYRTIDAVIAEELKPNPLTGKSASESSDSNKASSVLGEEAPPDQAPPEKPMHTSLPLAANLARAAVVLTAAEDEFSGVSRLDSRVGARFFHG
ncbi:hypothetical protein B0T25DRAFT_612179 [Lasiosphaeria hispida]|uniref:Protein kinase domain-containing protein n=1 Tax=Lasiosphaeria hispida TaxID=260671 RepID=A0AAJ0MAM8_9PEZI|nr:hypothetical protein B0T25DRAFT_612179 [Lasiosphaeria hispida]